MKFSHEFIQSLQKEQYPQLWVESALSYRKLKKCIKKVKLELEGYGLGTDVLNASWQLPNRGSSTSPWQYAFNNDAPGFQPKLTIALDPASGSPVDARLSKETCLFLERWARGERKLSVEGNDSVITPDETSQSRRSSVYENAIEVPLTTDGDFFQILQRELLNLERLGDSEKQNLGDEIVELGSELENMMLSSRSKAETRAWREIFRLYVDFEIFFSSREQDAGARDSQSVSLRLQDFSNTVNDLGHLSKLRAHGGSAFRHFVSINATILSLMKFQDLNNLATSKILKKFDKRTALQARTALPPDLFHGRKATQALAKAACFQVSQQLLDIFPQLSDYSCPICCDITWKPIRLRCDHVFCIRCLVVMQREKQNHCPLCRQECVLDATSDDIDLKLMEFLKAKFPNEVKVKQRENQRAAGIDQYGEDFNKKCMVM
ncbi:MAG: hypothetical protein Q9227_001925 [Pyrenula ochraceoflavens]